MNERVREALVRRTNGLTVFTQGGSARNPAKTGKRPNRRLRTVFECRPPRARLGRRCRRCAARTSCSCSCSHLDGMGGRKGGGNEGTDHLEIKKALGPDHNAAPGSQMIVFFKCPRAVLIDHAVIFPSASAPGFVSRVIRRGAGAMARVDVPGVAPESNPEPAAETTPAVNLSDVRMLGGDRIPDTGPGPNRRLAR